MNEKPQPQLKDRTPLAAAIGRSLDIYYRDTARTVRMDRLHALLVPSGALVFDIGAHVGDRTGSFLRLGATVVALEPQPHVFRALRLIYRGIPEAVLLPVAAGAEPGEVDLHLNLRNPTVSTVSWRFIAAAAGSPGWTDQNWERSVSVPVTTLDALIERYGRPDFVKIDVEGHEADVLQGAEHAVPMLSFEFTTIQREVARACIDQLGVLGSYEFNLSLGETHTLRHAHWLNSDALRLELDTLPHDANSGDVYARLV